MAEGAHRESGQPDQAAIALRETDEVLAHRNFARLERSIAKRCHLCFAIERQRDIADLDIALGEWSHDVVITHDHVNRIWLGQRRTSLLILTNRLRCTIPQRLNRHSGVTSEPQPHPRRWRLLPSLVGFARQVNVRATVTSSSSVSHGVG